MSRWWPERLVIGLAPGRVDLTRLGRWPSRRVDEHSSLNCEPQPGEAPWAAALRVLDTALPQTDGGAATVVLSNHFLRYLVLPWQPALTRASELDTLARLRFEQIHGPVVAAWTVQLSDGGYGAPLLACAVDTGLHTTLREHLERRGLRLASMQGLLMAAFNHHRRALTAAASTASADRPAALALVEPGRLCLALLAGGRWLAVSTRRVGADAAAIIEQELASLQLSPGTLDLLLVGDARCAPVDAVPITRRLAVPTAGLAVSPGQALDTAAASMFAASLAVWGTL
ncbi:MAG: hypothetical protein RL375_3980 [Pseudomonadota bacterium]